MPTQLKINQKLALGTVQFGLNYGISNIYGKTNKNEVGRILEFAWANGIKTIDTAGDYGNSEEVLGKQMNHPFEIITKLSIHKKDIAEIKISLDESLKKLNVENLYALLVHDAENLITNKEIWGALLAFKAKGVIKKIGYSLYYPYQLEQLIDLNMVPDIIQIPYNIIDNRFKSWLIELKKINCEIHSRSVFLQGLFFRKPEDLPNHFNEIKPLLKKLHEQFIDIEKLAAWLLLEVIKERNIDKVVFGVNNLEQLQNNLFNIAHPPAFKLESNYFMPDKILIPNLWNNE